MINDIKDSYIYEDKNKNINLFIYMKSIPCNINYYDYYKNDGKIDESKYFTITYKTGYDYPEQFSFIEIKNLIRIWKMKNIIKNNYETLKFYFPKLSRHQYNFYHIFTHNLLIN